jgi:hypothetical protein
VKTRRAASALAAAAILSCSSAAEPDPAPVMFNLMVQYDTIVQSYYTAQGQSYETRTPTTASISGSLLLDPFDEAPAGELTCATGCSGMAGTLKNYQGKDFPGSWKGDTLSITLYFSVSPITRLTLVGVYRGDSLSGSAERHYQTSTHTIHLGDFVARRRP